MEINNLSPGRKYSFHVVGIAANGAKSKESEEVVGSTGKITAAHSLACDHELDSGNPGE